jgi:hypothetical protein
MESQNEYKGMQISPWCTYPPARKSPKKPVT